MWGGVHLPVLFPKRFHIRRATAPKPRSQVIFSSCFVFKWSVLRPARTDFHSGGIPHRQEPGPQTRQSMTTTSSSDRKKVCPKRFATDGKRKPKEETRAHEKRRQRLQALPFSAGANTLSCKAGLLTRPGCGAFPVFTSGSDCRIPSCPRRAGLTAAGTVADSHGIPF